MTDTFWTGRRAEDVAVANSFVPITGATPVTVVEEFRTFQNAYYRFYNDGDLPNYRAMTRLGKVVSVEYDTSRREQSLENIGDALLTRVLTAKKNGTIDQIPTTPLAQ